MNWKLASAFTTGAVLASGIVYFSVSPLEAPNPIDAPKPGVTKAALPPHVLAAPQVTAPPDVPPERILTPRAQVHAPIPRIAVREKPSPIAPLVQRHKEVVIAQLEAPPASPASAAPTAPPPVPDPAPVPVQNVSLPAASTEVRVPHTVTLAAGTMLPVRIGETLSSSHNQTGDSFLATLTQPLVIDGFIIAVRGARVEGRVVDASPAGRVNGVSHLGISIVRIATDDGQNIRIRTEPYVKNAATSTGTDAATIGAGAAIGAVIGALAGGGPGAAIGAGVGGAAGAGGVLLTRGKPVEIPVESRVSFRVQDSVIITERLD